MRAGRRSYRPALTDLRAPKGGAAWNGEPPAAAHIVINDLPKVESLKRLFPDHDRAKPVLVSEILN